VAGSRTPMRFVSVALALARWGWRRRRSEHPRRILVLHHLLLGDTLMLTALLSKLRAHYPNSEIVMTVPRAIAPLYAGRPYGVIAHSFDPRDLGTFWALLNAPRFDLAVLPADNRWSWLARAIGARWIVGIAGDRPARKNWPVDQLLPYSATPTAFVETAAELIPGASPAPYRTPDWPMPESDGAPVFGTCYAVLHVGASSPLKLWPAQHWRELAAWLEARGMTVVWSAGPRETAILDAIEPASSARPRIEGTLSLPALGHVLANAKLLISPDTGIAHLGRIVGVPTVTLFGPGSSMIFGPGAFFANTSGRAVTVDPFPCRDQSIVFFRHVPWARRCERLFGEPPDRCPRPRCMEAIEVSAVTAAIQDLESVTDPNHCAGHIAAG
jgi:ADP-heptose:LPS heptosyltransferase